MALSVLVYLLWPTVKIRFGVIDDHEIVDAIDGRGRLPLGEVPGLLYELSNEPRARFRPVYWLGRLLESVVAGSNSTWWYLDRIVLAGLTVAALYLILVRVMHPAIAAAISLLPFCGGQVEVWARLGPNEAYAMPLTAIGAAWLVRAASNGSRPARMWPAYLLLLAAGLAKENFLLLGGVLVAASVLHWGLRRLRAADYAVLMGAALLWMGSGLTLYRRMQEYGEVYGQTRNFDAFLGWYYWAVQSLEPSTGLGLALVIAVSVLLTGDGPRVRYAFIALALTAVAVALQVVFYTGGPTAARYLYPLVLLSVAAWGTAAASARLLRMPAARIGVQVVIAVCLVFFVNRGIENAHAYAEGSAAATQGFQSNLRSIEKLIRQHDVEVVVIQPTDPWAEIERILSAARYLTARNDVDVTVLPTSTEEPSQGVNTWGLQGGPDVVPYDEPENCLSLMFNESEAVCPVAAPAPG